MGKSVYSVVLDDDVVHALDLAAMRAGMTRSAMINRLLAQQLQLSTPEQRIRSVFDAIEKLMADRYTTLHVLADPTPTQLSIRSALRYKYNPTVKYSIELFTGSSEYLGVLQIQLRTQNTVLVQALQEFYQIWSVLEQEGIGTFEALYSISGTGFSRVLRRPQHPCTEQQLADLLTRYVHVMDTCMKLYLAQMDDPQTAAVLTARQWQESLDDVLARL